jgi:hypothetical protein
MKNRSRRVLRRVDFTLLAENNLRHVDLRREPVWSKVIREEKMVVHDYQVGFCGALRKF